MVETTENPVDAKAVIIQAVRRYAAALKKLREVKKDPANANSKIWAAWYQQAKQEMDEYMKVQCRRDDVIGALKDKTLPGEDLSDDDCLEFSKEYAAAQDKFSAENRQTEEVRFAIAQAEYDVRVALSLVEDAITAQAAGVIA